MSELSKLANAILEIDEDLSLEIVDEKIEQGVSPIDIIKECNDGICAVGDLFEKKEYFLSELIMSGEIFKAIMDKLDPIIDSSKESIQSNKIVIGTVKDDIHDIGKNIVITLLKGTGFDVIDLGVDVEASKFVEAVKESGAKVVGLSCLLNFTFPQIKEVVEEFKKSGLREDVTIIIGGAPCNEDVRVYSGADYYALDAAATVNKSKEVYSSALA